MTYKHITSCIPLGQQKSKVQVMVEHGVPLGIAVAIIGAAASGGIGAAAGFGSTIGLAFILGFCDWWFHYRLICIKDDQCAVGTAGHTAVSTGLGDPDLDFTINLILAPVNRESMLNAADQISLLGPQQKRYFEPQVDASGQSYPPLGGIDENTTGGEGEAGTSGLHCEIEGNGMETVCTAATVAAVVGAIAGTALGIAAGAAIAAGCAATGPFALLCLLLALLVALIVAALTSAAATGIGWAIGVAIGGDEGSPADVAAEPGSGTVEVGDHVAILGDWIFDNAHDGWHELHPVKSLIRIPCPTGTKVPGVDVEEPHSQRSEDAIEKNCLALIANNAGETCRLLAQGRDPNVKQEQTNNDRPATHPRLG
jgi:hypothetical protein